MRRLLSPLLCGGSNRCHRTLHHITSTWRGATHAAMASRKEMPMALQLVGQNIDMFIGNARVNGEFPDDLATQLEELKRRSEVAEEDLPTPWQFAGEVVFIKPHGAGRQWR